MRDRISAKNFKGSIAHELRLGWGLNTLHKTKGRPNWLKGSGEGEEVETTWTPSSPGFRYKTWRVERGSSILI